MQRTFLACIALAFVLCNPAAATFPEKPVRLLVGYPGGDTADLIARIATPALAQSFKQPLIIENHPGANGNLAAARAAKARPDGYTLLFATAAFATSASLYSTLPYQPLRDFVPVARVANVHNVLVVQNSLGLKTLSAFIASVRASPGATAFASAGNGSLSHLASELMKLRVGPLNTLHVPYKGIVPALADLLGGHVHALFVQVPYAYPHVRSGRIRALAVASPKRASLLPEVPTFDESGIAGFEAVAWNGVVAPAGTPYDNLVRFDLALANALNSASVKARLAALGAEPVGDTPDQFSTYLRSEVEKWAKVIKSAGISAD